jgi:2-(1,2-epoxy-1,2-dihydrophenyl)acetyl-CoA isomerase
MDKRERTSLGGVMPTEELIVTQEGGVVTVTFNRPANMNALSTAILDEMPLILNRTLEDDSAKVLVITGAGDRAFCAGADVGQRLASGSLFEQQTRRKLIDPIGLWTSSLLNLPKPTIAAINGVAAGAGLTIALACDIRIASENARFTAAWIRRAMVPDGGTTALLPQVVGMAKAYEILYTGDTIDVATAERIGLVNSIVAPEDLMKKTMELATRLATGPSVAIELIKRAVRNALTCGFESQLEFETRAQNIVRETEDFKEGINSFLKKRKAVFKGK